MLKRAAPQLVRCLRTVQASSQAPAGSSWTLFGDLQPSSSNDWAAGHRNFASSPSEDPAETASSLADHASAIVEASTAAEANGLLAAAADVWLPTRVFLDTMAGVHDVFGIPWWGAIVATSCCVRLATLPLTVVQQRKSGVMMEITKGSKELQELQGAVARATQPGEYERANMRFVRAMNEFKIKHAKDFKFAYLMPLFGIVNAAVFISQFNAIRELAKEVPSMAHGGALWFQDLTIPDPFFGLPIACTLMTLGMVEFGVMSSEMNLQGQQGTILKWVFRGVALIFIPASQYVSSAVAVLWCTNSILAICQSMFLRHKRVRAALSLPDTSLLAAQSAESKEGLMARLTGKVQEAKAAIAGQEAPALAAAAMTAGSRPARARPVAGTAAAAAAEGAAATVKAPPPGTLSPPGHGVKVSGMNHYGPPKKKKKRSL